MIKRPGLWTSMAIMVFLLFGAAGSAAAQTWWNDAWQYRKKISFNTTVNGADIKENLMNVPVLIPPPHEPGEAPMNMSIMSRYRVSFAICLMGSVLSPAVRAVTD